MERAGQVYVNRHEEDEMVSGVGWGSPPRMPVPWSSSPGYLLSRQRLGTQKALLPHLLFLLLRFSFASNFGEDGLRGGSEGPKLPIDPHWIICSGLGLCGRPPSLAAPAGGEGRGGAACSGNPRIPPRRLLLPSSGGPLSQIGVPGAATFSPEERLAVPSSKGDWRGTPFLGLLAPVPACVPSPHRKSQATVPAAGSWRWSRWARCAVEAASSSSSTGCRS